MTPSENPFRLKDLKLATRANEELMKECKEFETEISELKIKSKIPRRERKIPRRERKNNNKSLTT